MGTILNCHKLSRYARNASSSDNSLVSPTRSQVTEFNATGLFTVIHSRLASHSDGSKTEVIVDCAHMTEKLVNQNLNYVYTWAHRYEVRLYRLYLYELM